MEEVKQIILCYVSDANFRKSDSDIYLMASTMDKAINLSKEKFGLSDFEVEKLRTETKTLVGNSFGLVFEAVTIDNLL